MHEANIFSGPHNVFVPQVTRVLDLLLRFSDDFWEMQFFNQSLRLRRVLLLLFLLPAIGADGAVLFCQLLPLVRYFAVRAELDSFKLRAALVAFAFCDCSCHTRYLFLSEGFYFVPPLDTMYYITGYILCQYLFRIFRKFFLQLSSVLSAFSNRQNCLYYNQ